MFDLLDKIGFYGKRFLLPVVFLVTGIILLYMALTPTVTEILTYRDGVVVPELTEYYEVHQNKGFLYGSLFFIMASVIWFLYLFGIVKSFIGYGLILIMLVISVGVLYFDYKIVDDQVKYEASYEMHDKDIKARMGDLKAAELAYKEANGTYTDSMDDLIDFVKTGKKMKILKKGKIPERKITPEERAYLYGDNRPLDKLMTEVEATALSKAPFAIEGLDPEFKRDTNFIPVMEAIFTDEKYVTNRDKIGATFGFHADSLRYVPYTTELVKLDTGSIEKDGGVVAPTLYIEMIHPMPKEIGKEESVKYTIGSTTSVQLNESWKDK